MYFAEDGPHAPEGPGWYLVITRQALAQDDVPAQEIAPHIRLSGDEMEKIGQVLDNFANGKPRNWRGTPFERVDMSIREAVRQGNQYIADRIRQRIIAVEQAVRNLDLLRKRHEEFESGSDDS